MVNTVTIPKIEYQRLKQVAKRYEVIREAIAPTLFSELPTEDTGTYAHPERIHRSFRNALKKYPVE